MRTFFDVFVSCRHQDHWRPRRYVIWGVLEEIQAPGATYWIKRELHIEEAKESWE